MSQQQLERELLRAQEMGRWLSDEELEELERDQRALRLEREQTAKRRLKLGLLTVICLIIPPLWPVALGLSLHLLVPQTFRLLLWFAGGSLLMLALLAVGAGVTVVSLIWMLIN